MTPYQLIRILVAALLCVLLGACGAAPKKPGLSIMTNNTSATPQTATTTFCMGRFLIDMPAGARLSGGNYKYDFAQLEKPVVMTFEQFQKELDTKEAKLKNTRHELEPSLLRASRKPDQNSHILAFWEYEGAAGLVNTSQY